ncbi:unnamed protein product, partial [Porites evermanni]
LTSVKCSLSRGVRPEDTFHCRKRQKISTSIKRTPLNMEICMSPPFGVCNKEVSLKRTVFEDENNYEDQINFNFPFSMNSKNIDTPEGFIILFS